MIVTSFIVAFKPSLENISQFQTVPLIYHNLEWSMCTHGVLRYVAVKDHIVSEFVKDGTL